MILILRSEQKEKTKQKLISCTLDLLEDKHFNQIGIREITRVAGLTPNAFYRHFDNKKILGLALIDLIKSNSIELLQEYQNLKDHSVILSEAINEKFISYFRKNIPYLKLIAQFTTSTDNEYRTGINQAIQDFVKGLEFAIEKVTGKSFHSKKSIKIVSEMMTINCLDICLREAYNEQPDWNKALNKLNDNAAFLFSQNTAL